MTCKASSVYTSLWVKCYPDFWHGFSWKMSSRLSIKAQIEHRYFSRRDPKKGCEHTVPFLNKLNKECSLRGLGRHVSETRDTLNLRMSGSHWTQGYQLVITPIFHPILKKILCFLRNSLVSGRKQLAVPYNLPAICMYFFHSKLTFKMGLNPNPRYAVWVIYTQEPSVGSWVHL